MLEFPNARRIALCCCLISFSNGLMAVEKTQSTELISVVSQALANHPLMQLAEAKLDQAKADAKAKSQPLYNPELALDFESNVENTSTVGLSQTLDWSNKQGAFKRIGKQNLLAFKAEFIRVRQSTAADVLSKINHAQSAQFISRLNQKQLTTLEELVRIANKQFAVGDISQIELDLALLSAGEVRMNTANLQAGIYRTQLQLESFFNFEKVIFPKLTVAQIQQDDTNVNILLQQHPRLSQLRTALEIAKEEIKLASRKATADPTLSFNAGKEGPQNIVSLGFSMPLFVRNNFSAEVDSAIANSVAVEQDYLNAYREALVDIKSSRKALQLNLSAFKRWQQQNQLALSTRAKLLQKIWKSGDLSTTNYLIQLQQTLDTQIAAVQLRTNVIDAWINYLKASGQLDQWLGM